MNQQFLEELSKSLKIAPLNIIREEAEMLLLSVIADSMIAKNLLFYGGTALRLAYNCPRFSEDLDFLQTGPVNEKALEKVLDEAVKMDGTLRVDEIKEKYHTLFAMVKIISPQLKHPLSVKIELSKRKNGIEKEFRPLSSPCSSFQPALYVAKLTSLKTAKIRAIKGRNFPRDWFDLWYISNLLKEPFSSSIPFSLNKIEFKREMKRFLPRSKWLLIDESIKAFA